MEVCEQTLCGLFYQNMIDDIYNTDVLRLAADISRVEPLDSPMPKYQCGPRSAAPPFRSN